MDGRRTSVSRLDLRATTAMAELAGVGLAISGMRPTGVTGADVVLSVLLAMWFVFAAGRVDGPAQLLAWLPLVLLVHGPVGIAAAGAGVVAAVARVLAEPRLGRRAALLGALSGAAMVAAVSDLGDAGVSGLSAAATAVALAVLTVPAARTLHHHTRAVVRRTALVVGPVVALVCALAALGALLARNDVAAARTDLRAAIAALRDGDADTARSLLTRANDSVASARGWIDVYWQRAALVLPVVGPNVDATVDVLRALDRAIDDLDHGASIATLEGLRLVDGRVDLDALRQLSAQVDVTAEAVLGVDAAVAEHDSPWLLPPLTDRLHEVTDAIGSVRDDLVRARDVLAVAPALLGGSGDRRYLAVFVTPSENRGGGGFPGQAAELLLRDGELSLGRQVRTDDLQPTEGREFTLSGVDEYLTRYGNFRVTSEWRNLTMSPHFPTVANVVRQFYAQSTGTTVDGVVRIGPRAFTALIGLTGPIDVEGLAEPLTVDNAFAYFTRDQYDGRYPIDNELRIAVQERVVDEMVRRLTEQRFDDPRRFGEVLAPAIAAGDLAMWTPAASEADALAAIHLGGRLPALRAGDSLVVTQHDLLTNKIDSWLRRDLQYDVSVSRLDDRTAFVDGTLTVTLHNDAPSSGPVLLVGNEEGLPTGTMRELVTVFTPLVVSDPMLDGEPVGSLPQTEQGRFAVGVTVEVAPGGSATLTVRVRGTVPLVDRSYRLTMPVVPAVQFDQVRVTVNGAVTERTHDRELVVDADGG